MVARDIKAGGEFCHKMSHMYEEYATPSRTNAAVIFTKSPMGKVGADLFQLKDSMYLLVVDYYSRYVEIQKLTSITSAGVISALKAIFSRHGIYLLSLGVTMARSLLHKR